MKRKIISALLIVCFLQAPLLFAEIEESFSSIRNNRYFAESVRLTNMAHAAFEEGDYDSSTWYAMEAIRFAELSDEFVFLQVKIKEASDLIATAEVMMNSASSANGANRFPSEYNNARTAISEARSDFSAENWDGVIDSAYRVINELAPYVETPSIVSSTPFTATPSATSPASPGSSPSTASGAFSTGPLPAQYTVQSWDIAKDCFWNIAGRPWVYNDPEQWRLLYNANRAKLPEPDNPNLIEPGTVLDIPSLRGETRTGMWQSGQNYGSVR